MSRVEWAVRVTWPDGESQIRGPWLRRADAENFIARCHACNDGRITELLSRTATSTAFEWAAVTS